MNAFTANRIASDAIEEGYPYTLTGVLRDIENAAKAGNFSCGLHPEISDDVASALQSLGYVIDESKGEVTWGDEEGL